MPGDHLKESGGARVFQTIVTRLPSMGVPTHQFVLLRTDDGSAEVSPDAAVPLTYGSDAARLRGGLGPGFLRLVQLARRASVVFVASEIGTSLLLGFAAARLTRRPFALLVQNRLSSSVDQWVQPALRGPTRWVHAHADLVMCVSEGLVAEVVANGLPADRAVVVGMGVDVDELLAAAQRPSPVAVEAPYLVAVGRLGAQKGFDVLIRAHAAIRGQAPDHRLVIVGEGPDHDELVRSAHELGVADTVLFTGFLDDPQPLISRAAAFVLSSRYEGMGLVVLEALAHGVPVIATDCVTGPRMLLQDGALGDLVPVDDVDALAGALAAHLASPGRLRDKAAGGEARAREFGPDRWVAGVRDQLLRLAGGAAQPAAVSRR